MSVYTSGSMVSSGGDRQGTLFLILHENNGCDPVLTMPCGCNVACGLVGWMSKLTLFRRSLECWTLECWPLFWLLTSSLFGKVWGANMFGDVIHVLSREILIFFPKLLLEYSFAFSAAKPASHRSNTVLLLYSRQQQYP